MDGQFASGRCRPGRRSRRGAMVVFVTVALVLLFVAAIFSVDMAYMFMVREQLHVATDAAAKAAVVVLAQGGGTLTASDTAVTYAGRNRVGGSGLTLTSNNVTFGRVLYNASGSWTFSSGGTPLIAAQVSGSVSAPLFFAPVLGSNTFTTRTTSTAAFVRNKWCLVLDRSGSMCFDMSGNDWYFPNPTSNPPGSKSYYLNSNYPAYPWPVRPAPNPPWPRTYPPDPTYSRYGNLYAGANAFLTALAASPGGTASNEVGMVTFGSSASTDCSFTSDYSGITTKLGYYLNNDIWVSGIANAGTNLSDGLTKALTMFTNDADKTIWNKIIIVFSDGQWNDGTDPINSGSPTLVSQISSANITIFTVGLLQQSNNTTMQDLATKTGGQFYYVTTANDLLSTFQKLAQTIPVILTQ